MDNKNFEVLSKIDHQKTVSTLSEMVKISSESPPGNEECICSFIKEKCESMGLKTQIVTFKEKRPSLVATFSKGKKGQVKLLNGHTDTVTIGDRASWTEDPYGASIKGGRMYGRGTCDMKGGLASMLVALETIVNAGLEPNSNWIFTAVADEEDLGRGTMALISSGVINAASFAIIGEPTNLEVVTSHRGCLWLEVTAHGKAMHGSTPMPGTNSIIAVSNLVKQLGELYPVARIPYTVNDTSLNVGTISGGTKINIVPEICSIGLDFRFGPHYYPGLIISSLEKVLRKMEEDNPLIKFTLKIVQRRKAVDTPVDHCLVQKSLDILSNTLNKRATPIGIPYTTDGSMLAENLGIPLIIFGPGKTALAHMADEYIELSDLENATKVFASLIMNL